MSDHPTYPVGSYVRMLKNVTWGTFTYRKGEKYRIVESWSHEHRPQVETFDLDSWYLEHDEVEKVIDSDPDQYFYDLVIGDDIGVHVETNEDAGKLLAWAHTKGFKWASKDSFLSSTNYLDYKENTVYCLEEGSYCDLNYARQEGLTIVNFSQHKNRI